MLVTLNGVVQPTDAATVLDLLGEVPPGHAVAVNGDVVPRARLATRPLDDGDVVELVTAVPGG